MVWIKICGLTRWEDAKLAVEYGADALGFIFCPSPRRVSPQEARVICQKLPKGVARVGVFQDQTQEEVQAIAVFCQLDYLQLHGQEDADYCQFFAPRAIKAVRVAGPEDLEQIEQWGTKMVLLDTYTPGKAGGTGQVFPWAWLKDNPSKGRASGLKIILAGGLNPYNVREALAQVQPFGVDVASGVESAPGLKDRFKVKAFMDQVRQSA
ncbi:MAG: phosphoribosylanthranilate isomerase [Syntrophomonadaceae bacterium]|nr:phosphoribosylanthranilate isomerase [Syntrophomonadaceae bacterium]